jgi:Zn-dependent protease with chaperone function
MSDVFKTALLLAVLTAMLVLLGGALGGQQGMLIAFMLALVMNVASYWFIVNPFSGQALMRLFSTHPQMEERIARLRSMRVGA